MRLNLSSEDQKGTKNWDFQNLSISLCFDKCADCASGVVCYHPSGQSVSSSYSNCTPSTASDTGRDLVIHYKKHEKYAEFHYKEVDFSVGTGKKSIIEKSPL